MISEQPCSSTLQKRISLLRSLLLFLPSIFLFELASAQNQVYDDFEGKKEISYGARSGVLDTNAVNPSPSKINESKKCSKYIRNADKKFDNIKMALSGKLYGVENYATYIGEPKQLKLKVYTSAPVGTLVEILLGSKGRNSEYPAGTHSQYQAYTSVSNEWEELEFRFSQIPQGSETTAGQIDQITLLLDPNSNNSTTYYFDELSGPPVTSNKQKPAETPANKSPEGKGKTSGGKKHNSSK